MRPRDPSEGIFFVIRLPHRWKLTCFRFDEHSDGGHLDFWEKQVAPALAAAWAPKLYKRTVTSDHLLLQADLNSELSLHYDGFPRGRVSWIEEKDTFAIYHGKNLNSGMKVTRKSVEAAFGIQGRARWEFDEHEQCSPSGAAGVRSALSLRESWNTSVVDFA